MPVVYSAIVMACTPLALVIAMSGAVHTGVPVTAFMPALRHWNQRSRGRRSSEGGAAVEKSTSTSGETTAASWSRVTAGRCSMTRRGETARMTASCSSVNGRAQSTWMGREERMREAGFESTELEGEEFGAGQLD